jgi:hypothetical protein
MCNLKKYDLYFYVFDPINVLLYIENMGGTPPCDELHECPIRACNFTKHTSNEINIATKGSDESHSKFVSDVEGRLGSFLVGSSAANATTISRLSTAILRKDTPTMDIGASCIGFQNAVATPKTEKFTHKRSSSLISCTIVCILVVAAAIIIWRSFVSRNDIRDQRPVSPNRAIAFPADSQRQ